MNKFIPLMWIAVIIYLVRWSVYFIIQHKPPSKATVNTIFYMLSPISCVKETFMRLNSFGVYDITILKTKLSLKAIEFLFIFFAAIIGLLLFSQEIFFTIIFIPVFYVILATEYNQQVDKEYLRIIAELPPYMSELQNAYISSSSVKQAVETTESKSVIAPIVLKMKQLVDKKKYADRAYAQLTNSGIDVVSGLAAIIYTTNQLGNATSALLDSPFVKDLMTIVNDTRSIYAMSLKRYKGMTAFKIIFMVTPVMVIGLNWFIQGKLLYIAHIYNGLYGTFAKMIITIGWSIAYYQLNQEAKVYLAKSYDGSSTLERFAKRHKGITQMFMPKKEDSNLRNMMILSASDQTMPVFYLRKVLDAVLVYIACFILICMTMTFSRINILNTYNSFGLSGNSGYVEELKDYFFEADSYFLVGEGRAEFTKLTDEELADYYSGKIPELTKSKALNNVERIKAKRDVYDSMIIPWWITLALLIVAVLAYNIPDVMLKMRKNLRDRIRRAEVRLMSTLLVILSDTNDSLYEIMGNIAEHCNVLKKEIYFAREMVAYDNITLRERKDRVGKDLGYIYSKLYYVSYNLLPCESFRDMVEYKKNDIRISEIEEEARLEAARQTFIGLTIFILVATSIMLVGGPLLVVAMSQITDAMKQFGQ